MLSSGLAAWLVDLKSDNGYSHPETAAEVGLISGFAFLMREPSKMSSIS
jgi:hypothetical protein